MKFTNKNTQKGFTLIELTMVIIIIGILAAVALPKFVNLKSAAQQAAMLGVKDAIESAGFINEATRQLSAISASASAAAAASSASSASSVVSGTVTVGMSCNDGAAAILRSGLPAGYSLDSTVLVVGDNKCTLTLMNAASTMPVNVIGSN